MQGAAIAVPATETVEDELVGFITEARPATSEELIQLLNSSITPGDARNTIRTAIEYRTPIEVIEKALESQPPCLADILTAFAVTTLERELVAA